MTTFYIALGIAIGAAVADLIHRYILPTYLDGRQDVQDEIDHSRRVAGHKAAQTRKMRQDATALTDGSEGAE